MCWFTLGKEKLIVFQNDYPIWPIYISIRSYCNVQQAIELCKYNED